MATLHNHAASMGRLLAAALLPVVLAACAAERERQIAFSSWKQADPAPRAQVAQVPVNHEVRFAPADLQISDIEREALYLFLARTGVRPGDQVRLSVAVPTAADATRAGNRLASVRAELIRQGIQPTILASGSSGPAPGPDRVLVTATTLAVLPIDCPGYNAPIQFDYEHRPLLNPGCANAINLGLMVANPADLAQGQPMSPGDAEFGATAVQRYRAGAVYPYGGQEQQKVPFRLTTN